MLDLLIRNGSLVDGTGAPARRADVGIRDGRIVSVAEPGAIDDAATNTLDAEGLVVTPGFVDPHTHYDAQLFWDPGASPSNVHGVTSVIGGNCGFTLAPLKARDADYLRRMMAKVEGMPLPALETGIEWDWETFAGYLDRLDGNIGVNAGFLVGHCALRRYVMGDESVGNEASPDQLNAMVELLHQSIEAGGLGFSTTLSYTHSDGDGEPVPSRWATHNEVLALCAAVRDHEGTTLEAIVDGCLDQFSDDEIELLVAMSVAGQRPLNWNVLTVDSRVPERVTRQLEASSRAQTAGGRIVALTMPVIVPMNMSFLNYCALFMLPGWKEVMSLPVPERIAKLADPTTRAWMNDRAHSDEAGVFRRLADWGNYVLGDTYSDANEGLEGKTVRDVAADRDQTAFDTLIDIVISDDLRTILWPIAPDGDAASWELRRSVWEDPRAMLGGSDAGAHLDRMCGAPYTSRFLGDMLRGRKLMPLERAVQLITDVPAQLFGLRDRGRVAPGMHADLVVFNPETIGSEPATLVNDLPGGTARLTAGSLGVEHVYVNGVETVTAGVSTGARPGTILRSGRDTRTVPIAPG
ncbi:MAG TPA: D-aminoacylase [Acidimicrobiia bacterium]|nr:D-aminoacylase [Acidimicrobiia bacterium]